MVRVRGLLWAQSRAGHGTAAKAGERSTERRPLATWVTIRGSRRRLTVAPRSDPETGEVYGVALRLASG